MLSAFVPQADAFAYGLRRGEMVVFKKTKREIAWVGRRLPFLVLQIFNCQLCLRREGVPA
ncbi:hypothetical protein DSLASN_48640 [Desulfoluna limicola]|uniref:Uncharacterized protein n=1 Tax=Desulfoluna limicola TaxID=2810562 RepID=A0ABN6FCA7_9BACT|nr:hypothetical protein DSLASN_48640 [Desulfoluna limicola]